LAKEDPLPDSENPAPKAELDDVARAITAMAVVILIRSLLSISLLRLVVYLVNRFSMTY